MKVKIVCILVITLLIATVIPSISGNVIKKANFSAIQDYEFVPGEFIVKFTEGTKLSDSVIVNLNEHNQVSSIEKIFKNAENTILDNIYILTVPKDSDIVSIVNEYSSLPNVEYAEPNIIGDFCLTPNDEYFQYQWSLHNIGQNIFPPGYPPLYGTPDADIDAPEAWDIETGDQDVIIALIDSGIDYTHPDLADRIWVNENEIPDNEVDDDGNGFIDDVMGWDFPYNDSDPLDLYGHGTICGGVFGAVTNNNIGIAGVSWYSKIMITKIAYDDGVNLVSDWVKGIRYAADNNADIMSMQIITYTNPGILRDTIDYAYDKGVFMCASAGNDNTSVKGYPAAYDKVLAVAATNQHDERCDEDDWDWAPGKGSNYGDWVDVAAPGNWIATTSPTYPFYMYPGNPMNYTSNRGTSLSCPFVAGVAGLILSRNPAFSPEEVRSIIKTNVDPYDSEYYIGTGRINAYKAIIGANKPPGAPIITGETNGKIGVEYEYTFNAVDPDGDNVKYFIGWDDGDPEETGFNLSGDDVKLKNTWNSKGTYTIRAYAEDEFGLIGPEGTLDVTIPRTRTSYWFRFLDMFPILQRILQLLE